MNAPAKRFVKLVSAPLLLAGLAACAASPFKADVQRFQTQLPAPDGQTFAVVAEDPALAGGLEFAQYADYVEAEMQRLGYAETNPENADLLVRFDYGVDNGREKIRSTGFSDPYWGSWYGRGGYGYRSRFYDPFYRPFYRSHYSRYSPAWGYGWHDPFFGGPEIRSYTVYTSDIDVKIDRRVDGQRLFEGKAEAASTSDRLQYLVPNLVDAMFTDFPGSSGETVRISIAPESREKKVKRID